jgi:hypothetical protein
MVVVLDAWRYDRRTTTRSISLLHALAVRTCVVHACMGRWQHITVPSTADKTSRRPHSYI